MQIQQPQRPAASSSVVDSWFLFPVKETNAVFSALKLLLNADQIASSTQLASSHMHYPVYGQRLSKRRTIGSKRLMRGDGPLRDGEIMEGGRGKCFRREPKNVDFPSMAQRIYMPTHTECGTIRADDSVVKR
ncbi:hypothetical protein LGM39_15885 [Burkholderia cepacia]|uniref:hypothetical protein n=1 Tax=Burkholderia cepacia TaxID=292 RepID=UPI001CF0EADF|nr:hypothetical protein [Burkholderia cepacia]MCA7900859.1 hypothetical protein [Burkholderia cepacia]